MNPSRQFDTCILCRGTDLRELDGYQKDYLVKCTHCHFVFCRRIPTPEELVAHYSQYSRNNSISPITVKRYDALLDRMEKFRRTNRILDTGCGDGFFLVQAKKRGWDVFGVEFTDEAVEVCANKGITMRKGPLNEHTFEPAYFDIITTFEVIEHINNPREEVAIFSKLLRGGGLVYVTTPNFNSLSRDLLKGKWRMIQYPEHLSYYTRGTLRKLFEQNSFRMMSSTTTGLSLRRIQNSSEISATGGAERLRKELEEKAWLGLLKKVINFALNVTGKGHAMKAFFQKPG